MRVLVTGGAGFIGSHIVDRYIDMGYDVHIVDNLTSGKTSHINNKATLHEIDICSDSFGKLLTEIKPDAVNHHAAQASVKISVLDPKHDLLVNGSGTANVALLSAMHGVKHLIYASSGGTLYGQPLKNPVHENAEIKPLSPYGVSKFAGEEYVKFVARSSEMNTTIFRYGNVFGPRQDPSGEAGVIAIFAGNLLTGKPCIIDGDGEQVKDYIYVSDIADINTLVLEGDSSKVNETFNIGTGTGTSVNTIYRTLREQIGSDITPSYGPPRIGDVRRIFLDCSFVKRQIGWQVKKTFSEGIENTIAALKNP